MKANKVDIIIPVYNVEPYLRRCLNSMLAQTYTHWRAICVDDGSTDGSPAILDEYAAKDSRFKVIHQENGGLSHARNEGLAVADAEYVMFVDSDDFIHPQTLELAVGLIERDGTDMVSWYRDSFYRNVQLKLMRRFKVNTDKAGAWRSPFKYRLGRIKTVVTDDALKYASDWNQPEQKFAIKHCFVWRHLFERSLIKDVKFIKGMKYEDIPWWSELLMKPIKTTVTQLPLYYYYVNRKSISKSINELERLEALLNGLSLIQKMYQNNGDMERLQMWSHNIKWAILVRGTKALARIMVSPDADKLVHYISDMVKTGLFDNATTPVELKAKEAYYTVAAGQKFSL